MIPRIKKLQPKEDFRLLVEFDDGKRLAFKSCFGKKFWRNKRQIKQTGHLALSGISRRFLHI